MYYFMEENDNDSQEAYIPYNVNPWRIVSECDCKSRQTEYDEPIKFDIKGKLCDYYFADNQIMISERFYSFLKEKALTGYITRNAVVRTWNKSEKKTDDLKYYELVVKGRCGLLRDMSGDELPHCQKCGRRVAHTGALIDGVTFDMDQYDGSDIFAFDNLWNIPIVSETLRNAIIECGFTNIKFIPLSEKVFDDRISRNLVNKWLTEGKTSDELIEAWLKYGVITEDDLR